MVGRLTGLKPIKIEIYSAKERLLFITFFEQVSQAIQRNSFISQLSGEEKLYTGLRTHILQVLGVYFRAVGHLT